MQKLIELYGIGFGLGQAGKKMQEAQRMEVEPAVRELLGGDQLYRRSCDPSGEGPVRGCEKRYRALAKRCARLRREG